MILVGLIALLVGADLLVRGVSGIARTAGISPLVIGLTVVAFGTSTPEVVINGISAWRGETALAFGNIIGSCTINIGFVLALTALIRPLNVERSMVTRELPLLLLTVAIFAVLTADRALNHEPIDRLSRGDGIVLLLLFCVFVYSLVRVALATRSRDPLIQEVEQATSAQPTTVSWIPLIAMTLLGLLGVAGGGRLAVSGAVELATRLGVSDVIIGLTIVSFGTTLPELATCITATRRGQSDIALGNVVGSNLYNLQFIGGLVATIRPVPLPAGAALDLGALAVLSVMLLPVALRQQRVTRAEGAFLLLLYLGYLSFRLTRTA